MSDVEKLDPRLRALLALDQKELLRIKREEDRLLREELDAIEALRKQALEIRDDQERFERVSAQIAEREAAFPVPSTFGLYLPEDNPSAAARVTHLRVPFISAIIRSEANAQDLSAIGLHVRNQAGKIFTAYVPLQLCGRLSQSSAIDYVELSRPWRPQLDTVIPKARIDQVHLGGTMGTGVIIGIIEQTPLDFYHEHFRNGDGSSRVLYLWDQTLSAVTSTVTGTKESGPTVNPGFGGGDGVEYSQGQINSELNNPGTHYLIVRSEPQVADTHGTLVASCAAGSGHNQAGQKIYVGAAPKADIIYVRTRGNELRYGNVLADSANVLDAFAYIFAWALQLQKPCVVNLSLSDNLGGHDGSNNGEQFLDTLLLVPGRAITCSAGNVNISELHTNGKVVQGGTTDVIWVYPTGAKNVDTLQLWYDGHDQFTVWLTVPTLSVPIGPIAPGGFDETTLAGGVIKVSVQSSVYPNNGDNLVEVRITGVSAATPIPSGDWILKVEGTSVINGAFDAWIDRNNVSPFPGVKVQSPVQDGTVVVPATARRPISVGAHDNLGGTCENPGNPKPGILNISGCGPTRDGRVKPEIAGPGVVKGALAMNMNQPAPSGYPLSPEMQGTSVAAPIVAGAAALLFECRGSGLTSSDIKQLLLSSAKPPNGPLPAFGFGYLCMDGICTAPTPAVDIWLRDSPTDTGIEPYVGGVTWLSPDIEVLDAAANPTPNPTYDPTNPWNALIDVTVRNRGTQTARNVEVFLYWADPATNIPFPSEWQSSGIFTGQPAFVQQNNKIVIAQLMAGANTTVHFAWAPPAPGSSIRGDDHFCLIARVEHEADPSNVNTGGWSVVQGSNNVALRNVHVQDGSGGDVTIGCFVVGSGDVDALELSCEKVAGDIELFLPTRALPWRELALLERYEGQRPSYGDRSRRHPSEEVRRILEGQEVTRILEVTGAERAHVDGATTRIVAAGRNSAHLVLPEVRVQQSARMPVRVWVRRPHLEDGVGRVNVGQRSGGKLIGGVSLELRRQLSAAREYDVRRRGDQVDVTPRRDPRTFPRDLRR